MAEDTISSRGNGEKMSIIKERLQEVLGEDKMLQVMQERDLKIYWGTATTGRPHIGYFVPMMKVADFLSCGSAVTILFADLHAYLDNMKAPWNLLYQRTLYYEHVIKATLLSVGVSLEKLRFVRGTDFELSYEYSRDILSLITLVTEHDAKKAGAEVVKQVDLDHALVSGLLYPVLQSLDEEYLGVDVQFGGVDQRKIFMLAEKYLPHMSFAKRAHLMNPMVPGLCGDKMSSSEETSKIDLLDSAEVVERKLSMAVCPSHESNSASKNGLIAFLEYVIFPAMKGKSLDIEREEGKITSTYASATELEKAFLLGEVSDSELRSLVAREINRLLSPVREDMSSEDAQRLTSFAYPPVTSLQEKCLDPVEVLSHDLQALSTENVLSKKLSWIREQKLHVMWTVVPSRKPHIGFLPILHCLSSLSTAGCKVSICVTDVAGFLDGKKTPWALQKSRFQLYVAFLSCVLFDIYGAQKDLIHFVKASDIQMTETFILDFYRLASLVTVKQARKASEGLVTPQEHPTLAGLVSPLFQVLLEKFLSVDVHFGGEDMRHLFTFAEEVFPLLNFCPRGHVVFPLVPGLTGGKMGSSNEDNVIGLDETLPQIRKRVKRAFCEPQNVDMNPSLEWIRDIILPFWGEKEFVISRKPEFGGDISFSSFDQVKEMFAQELHPGDLKSGVEKALVDLLSPVRTFTETSEYKDMLEAAYPVVKFVKKKKLKQAGNRGGAA